MIRLTKSVRAASRGVIYAAKHERNFRIELYCAAIVLVLMVVLGVHGWDAVLILFMILFVLTMELVNTAMERIVDILKPRIHPYAKVIKDLMAAAVLISSIIAIVIGVIIFLPYFYR